MVSKKKILDRFKIPKQLSDEKYNLFLRLNSELLNDLSKITRDTKFKINSTRRPIGVNSETVMDYLSRYYSEGGVDILKVVGDLTRTPVGNIILPEQFTQEDIQEQEKIEEILEETKVEEKVEETKQRTGAELRQQDVELLNMMRGSDKKERLEKIRREVEQKNISSEDVNVGVRIPTTQELDTLDLIEEIEEEVGLVSGEPTETVDELLQEIEEELETPQGFDTIREIEKQIEETVNMGLEDRPAINITIVDEPQVPDNIDYETVEGMESLFQVVTTIPDEHNVEPEITQAAVEGLQIIQQTRGQPKQSIFQKIGGFVKKALGWVSTAGAFIPFLEPFVVPARTALGIIETVETIASGDVGDITNLVLDTIGERNQLIGVATDTLNTLNTVRDTANQILGNNENRNSVDSQALVTNVGSGEIQREIDYTNSLITQTGQGQIVNQDVPLQVENAVITPNEVATLTDNGDGGLLPPGDGDPDNEVVTNYHNPDEELANQEQVLIGNQQGDYYKSPIHNDALNFYFGNANYPKWNYNLLEGRKSSWLNLPIEQQSKYLLQQSKMLIDKYGAQFLIPQLVHLTGDKMIIKENHEILQIFNKYKSIHVTSKVEVVNQPTEKSDDEKKKPEEPQDDTTNHNETQGSEIRESRSNVRGGFNYQPQSSIRVGTVISKEDSKDFYQPSLSEVVHLKGSIPLTERSTNAAPAKTMNELRHSVAGTAQRMSRRGYNRINPFVNNLRVSQPRIQSKNTVRICENI